MRNQLILIILIYNLLDLGMISAGTVTVDQLQTWQSDDHLSGLFQVGSTYAALSEQATKVVHRAGTTLPTSKCRLALHGSKLYMLQLIGLTIYEVWPITISRAGGDDHVWESEQQSC